MNQRQRKKWLKQHGNYINPRETWSLDVTLAEHIYPRLVLFKKLNNGYPTCFETIDEWNEVLDKMIFAFKKLAENHWFFSIQEADWKQKEEQLWKQIGEGLDLFAKYYTDLWW